MTPFCCLAAVLQLGVLTVLVPMQVQLIGLAQAL